MAVVVCALAGVAPLVSRAVTPDRPARAAADLDDALRVSGSRPVVVFVHGTSRSAAVEAIDTAGLELITVFESVGVPVAAGTPAQIRTLLDAEGVTYVEPNRELDLLLDTSRVAIRAREAKKTPGLGFDGRGQTIAIVDTGVDGTHPMFTLPDGSSKVVRNLKVACEDVLCPRGEPVDSFLVDVEPFGNDSDTLSLGGHGTHVAGIAAGVRVESPAGHAFSGVATGAKIVSISAGQVISVYGASAALDWIARHHADPCGDRSCPPITVVNNSYGATAEFDVNSIRTKLQNAIVDAGVVMVWANGNGDDLNDGGDGSDNRSGGDAQNPKPGILSVANYDDGGTGTRDGSLDASSSRGHAARPGTWPDLSAPGTAITSACRPQLVICSGAGADPNYGTISGTSMAAPHVAGVVALLRQANPALTPAQIEDILEDTAHKFVFGAPYQLSPKTGNDTGSSFDKGHGLVDVVAALGRALNTSVAPPPAPMCSTGPSIVDGAGDASEPAGPSEPTLDIRAVRIGWDATAKSLRFVLTLEDLAETNPPGTAAIAYDVGFGHANGVYAVHASRDSTGATSAVLLREASPSRQTLADIETAFDPAADTVTIVLRNRHLEGTDVPRFADGMQLTGLTANAFRYVGTPAGSVGFYTDRAAGTCAFSLGAPPPATGATPFPETPVPLDGTVTAAKGFEVSGVSPANNVQHTCAGPRDPSCLTYVVEVQAAKAATLVVSLSSAMVADDWDLYLYDQNGTGVTSSGNPTTVLEEVSIPASGTVRYTIVVQPFLATTASPFTLTATLQ